MYANLTAVTQVVATPLMCYTFQPGDYYAEESELAIAVTGGQLTQVAATYASSHDLATRLLTNVEDTTEDHIIADIVNLHREANSRLRVWPRLPGDVIAIVSGGANVYGGWTGVIPANEVEFDYHLTGFTVEDVVAATYHIQFACALVPTDTQILGEQRFIMGAAAAILPAPEINFKCPRVVANGGVWARTMCTLATQTTRISVRLTHHVVFPYPDSPEPHWPDWPW